MKIKGMFSKVVQRALAKAILFFLIVATGLSNVSAATTLNSVGAVEAHRNIISYGAFDNSPDGIITGAPWRIYESGTLVVDGGFLEWSYWSSLYNATISPWYEYRYDILDIIFTDSITAGKSLGGLFSLLHNARSIEGLCNIDTTNVIDMGSMFAWTYSLTNLDLSMWNTSNVVNMSNMFTHASNLKYLNISGWDVSRVQTMNGMFVWVDSLASINLTNWDTSATISMNGMFHHASSLEYLDLSGWDTSNVVDMRGMFSLASSLSSLNIAGWDTSNVINMGLMFEETPSLSQIIFGQYTRFFYTYCVWNGWQSPGFPDVPRNTQFTGRWQNVGDGTADEPAGDFAFTSIQLIEYFDGSVHADTWVWQPRNADVTIIAHGAFPDCPESNIPGAVWQLFETKELIVGGGFIVSSHERAGAFSPWYQYQSYITHILFSQPVVAGQCMTGFFARLTHVTAICGLEMIDTSGVIYMNLMFYRANMLEILDLSSWDVSNATEMWGMFTRAYNLRCLDTTNWNTSNVANMGQMFVLTYNLTSLDLSGWDTSNVWAMYGMFGNMSSLVYLNVSGWITSNVTNMSAMFAGASRLERLDLSGWDASRVNVMQGMFSGANNLREIILGEDFRFVQRTNPPISPDLPPVPYNTDFTGFWQNVYTGTPDNPQGRHVLTSDELMLLFNGSIHADTWVWQPRRNLDDALISLGRFPDCPDSTMPGSEWRLYSSGVLAIESGFVVIPWVNDSWIFPLFWTDYRNLIERIEFRGAVKAGDGIQALFASMENLTDIEGLELIDTSNIINLGMLFQDSSGLTNLEGLQGWNTSNVESFTQVFLRLNNLTHLDLSQWDTRNATDFQNMFMGVTNLTYLNVSGWDTRNVVNMASMFSGASSLERLDLSSWDTGNVWAMSWMFNGMSSLRELVLGENFRFLPRNAFVGDAALPEPPSNEYFTGYWQNVGSGTEVAPNGEFVLTAVQLMEYFDGSIHADTWVWQPHAKTNNLIAQGQFPNCPYSAIQGSSWRIYNCGTLYIDTGFVYWSNLLGFWGPWYVYRNYIFHIEITGSILAGSSIQRLFAMLPYVVAIEGLTFLDTSNVKNMNQVFRGAYSLKSIDVSNWDTSSVINMTGMFNTATGLMHVDVSSWDTSSVVYMVAMFTGANNLKYLDVSAWNTSSVTNMSHMFQVASNLEYLDVSNWDTSSVTNMWSMFGWASNLVALDVSNWDTSLVTDMATMFAGAANLEKLDMSNWDTSSVESMLMMFANADSLKMLTLGESFQFVGGSEAQLPMVLSNAGFSGYWQNVGEGTFYMPAGDFAFTSAQLMAYFYGSIHAGTWVWQPIISGANDNFTIAGTVSSHHARVGVGITINLYRIGAGNSTVLVDSATIQAGGSVGASFVFEDVERGIYRIRITKPGHLPLVIDDIVVEGLDVNLANLMPNITLIPGSITGGDTIGAADIAELLGLWGTSDSRGTLSGGNIVGAEDIAVLLGNWGMTAE